MASAIPTTFSLPTPSLGPVEDAEGQKRVGATKTPLVITEGFVPSLVSLTPSGHGDGQQLAIKEDAGASKSLRVIVKEIPLSTIPFESVQGVKRREVTIEEDVEAVKSPLVEVEDQDTRYHEDEKAHYCLPNEQVSP
jgi:hypothetical protein